MVRVYCAQLSERNAARLDASHDYLPIRRIECCFNRNARSVLQESHRDWYSDRIACPYYNRCCVSPARNLIAGAIYYAFDNLFQSYVEVVIVGGSDLVGAGG